MKTEVIGFSGRRFSDLQIEINCYSELFKCEVLSVSLTEKKGNFFAMVVFQYGDEATP